MEKAEKYLVIITPGFPANEGDSTCLPSQQQLVRALNRLEPSLEILILTYEYPFTKIGYWWFSNEVIPFNGWKKGFWRKSVTFLAMIKVLRRIYRDKNIIGILSFWASAGAIVGKYFARLHGLIHYTWILGQDARKENKYVRFLAPKPEELIALSISLQREFQKNHHIKPKWIIPNAIDISLYGSEDAIRDIDILGVGSLTTLKQYNILIRVVKTLTETYPLIRAVICGKGPEHDVLLSLIHELGLSQNITLIGEKPHEVVLLLMQRARILLHPSSYEGFSTVCLEALYAGAHVISFCNPKDNWVNHWHIVEDESAMTEIALDLLEEENLNHDPVILYRIEDQADSLLKLFKDSSTA